MSKRTKGIIITGVLLVIAIATLSYALWNKTFTQTGENELASGCFDIQFTNETDEINLQNAYPMTDEEGMATESYDVTIKNACTTTVKYDVILNPITGNDLADSHIKVGVENNVTLLTENHKVDNKINSDVKAYRIKEGIIASDGKQTLKLRIWMDEDTSEDEGENKTFKSKVTIDSAATGFKQLTATILANNTLKYEIPQFSVGEPPEDNSPTTGSGVYQAEDDDGISFYFRGDKSKLNNNIIFGKDNGGKDLHWKIIRINGDGTIRLMLVDDYWNINGSQLIGRSSFNNYYESEETKHDMVGFTYNNSKGKECTQEHPCEVRYSNKIFTNKFGGTNSDIKTYLETWYTSNLDNVDNQIEYGTFCNDTSSPSYEYNPDSSVLVRYGADNRLDKQQPSLKCPNPKDKNGLVRPYGGVYKTKIGLITADEINLAGVPWYNIYSSSENYIYTLYDWPFTMSPYVSGINAVYLWGEGSLLYEGVRTYDHYYVIPVINLKSDTQVSGTGTTDDPFVVN